MSGCQSCYPMVDGENRAAFDSVGQPPAIDESMLRGIQNDLNIGSLAQSVLVVEDNENNARIVQTLVQRLGFPALVASNAKEALRYCETETPALILMDIGLPDVDGLRLTTMIRDLPGYENIPIVAVTAHTEEIVEQAAIDCGCDFFIGKPFRPTEFAEKIKPFLPKD